MEKTDREFKAEPSFWHNTLKRRVNGRPTLINGFYLTEEIMPEFDGTYYVCGYKYEECGAIHEFHIIAECRNNEWVKPDVGYQMMYWREKLVFPKVKSIVE